MRISILLLATSSCAHAAWLRWSINREPVWAARETGHVMEADQTTGWTPIPTPAPGLRKDGEVVLDLLRRDSKKSTEWTNSETCGWFSGISSSALLCGNDFSCVTNSQHIVACASGTLSPFYSACLDYSAFKAGSCLSLDGATGCCQDATEPACGTYIWTGSPERYMYKCFEKASIISVLDVPQFVIDASIFSQTHTTPKPTTTTKSGTPTNAPGSGSGSGHGGSPPDNSGGNPSSGTALPGSGSGGGSGSGSGSTTNNSSNSGSSNIPVIVGAAVGGLAGLLFLLLLLWCCLRRRKTNGVKGKLGLGLTRNKKNKKEDNSSKTFHSTNINAAVKRNHSSGSDTTTGKPGPSQPPQQHHYYHNQEQHHYHSQGQVQQPIMPGQQPISVTVNDHSRQPSISNSTQMAAPSHPNGAGPHFVLGGIIPTGHAKDDRGKSQGFVGGSEPLSRSTTLNEGSSTHMRQPSYPPNAYVPASSSSSGGHPSYVVGGIVPVSMGHHSNEHPLQQQPQVQQPVNHIHVYYAPAPAMSAQLPSGQNIASTTTSSQYSSTYTSPNPDANANVKTRGGGGRDEVQQDALGIYTRSSEYYHHQQSQSQSHSHSRSESRSRSPGEQQTHINIQAQAQSHSQAQLQEKGGYAEKERRSRERSPSPSQSRGRDLTRNQNQYNSYPHDDNANNHNNNNTRDVSAVSSSASSRRSPSPDFYDGEWRGATGGPGYRQSM